MKESLKLPEVRIFKREGKPPNESDIIVKFRLLTHVSTGDVAYVVQDVHVEDMHHIKEAYVAPFRKMEERKKLTFRCLLYSEEFIDPELIVSFCGQYGFEEVQQ